MLTPSFPSSAVRSSQPEQRLTVSSSSLLFSLTPSTDHSTLSFVDLKSLKLKGSSFATPKRVDCSPPLPPDCFSIVCNEKEHFLLVIAPQSLIIIKFSFSSLASSLLVNPSIDSFKCRSHLIAPYYLKGRNTIKCAQFHPLSSNHLLLLTSDNRLRLFDLKRDIEVAEQEFNLNSPLNGLKSIGIQGNSSKTNYKKAVKQSFIRFTFGCSSLGWDCFTIYLLSVDGSLSALCPVFPYQSQAPLALIQQLIQMENKILRENQPNDENEELSALEAYQSECRIRWLRESFFSPDEDELTTNKQSCLSRKGCELSAIIQIPVDLGRATELNDTGDGDEYSDSLLCAFDFIRIPSSSLPMRFVRSFTNGRIDLILGISNIQPLFDYQFLNIPDWSSRFSIASSLVPVEPIHLQLNDQNPLLSVLCDRHDPAILIVHTRFTQFILKFPWIDDIQHLLNSEGRHSALALSVDLQERLTSAIASSKTEVKILHSAKSRAFSAALISDPVLGRYFIGSERSHENDAKAQPIIIEIPRIRFQIAKKFEAPPVPEVKTLELLGIQPFSVEIAPFMKKYAARGFRIPYSPSAAPIHLTNPTHLERFLQQKKVFATVWSDLNTVQGQIQNRIKTLQVMEEQQEKLFQAIEEKMLKIIQRQEILDTNMEKHMEIQKQVVENTRELLSRAMESQFLSKEERKFQEFVKEQYEALDHYAEQVENVQVRAAETEAKAKRVGSTSLSLVPSHHLTKLQPALADQTEAIRELIERVNQMKSQISQIRESAEAIKFSTAADRATSGNLV